MSAHVMISKCFGCDGLVAFIVKINSNVSFGMKMCYQFAVYASNGVSTYKLFMINGNRIRISSIEIPFVGNCAHSKNKYTMEIKANMYSNVNEWASVWERERRELMQCIFFGEYMKLESLQWKISLRSQLFDFNVDGIPISHES